jgi:hypothetical protein
MEVEGQTIDMTTAARNRLLSAASLAILFFAVVPGMAYTGAWSGPEGDVTVIVAEEAAASHHHDHTNGDSHGAGGAEQCRVGPSKCTGQPSFVSTTWLGGQAWSLVPPSQAREIFGPGHELAFQPPVYRMKPPPRGA